jgi:hypothetical protein
MARQLHGAGCAPAREAHGNERAAPVVVINPRWRAGEQLILRKDSHAAIFCWNMLDGSALKLVLMRWQIPDKGHLRPFKPQPQNFKDKQL